MTEDELVLDQKLQDQFEAVDEILAPLRVTPESYPIVCECRTIGIVAIEVALTMAPSAILLLEQGGWTIVCSMSCGLVFRKRI